MVHTTADRKHTNRLIQETSPYLLQHAHNPVDWYPWGTEALDRARREDKLILLSIGYSACHWCHVMEHESFENDEVAAVMNEHFVSIKVDREERPDLDDIYMAATVVMNHGQGGWPMTVFLTPELQPVYAGTYFPPDDRHGRPGFKTLLTSMAHAWRANRDSLEGTATELVEHLRQQQEAGPALAVGETELRLALKQFADDFDASYGGFGSAPKFPPATGLSLLLRLHRRFDDPQARLMVQKTLYAMGQGGMYDQIGGGFHRYATDRRWLVPHFEKMLYDNALLAKAYLDAYQVSGDPFYRRIATETLDYILREMTSPKGGFYSSTDADSEGEEGKFFVWTPEEIVAILGSQDGERFNAYYDITVGGNWEGKSIPNTPRPITAVAQPLGITSDELAQTLERARTAVFEARAKRVGPGLDDKILTAWNGLAIGALAEGYRILRTVPYLDAASRAAEFLRSNLLQEDGRLLRTYREGRAHLNAYLEDYAYLADALLDLYEAGGDIRHLHEAARLVEIIVRDFRDDDTGAFFSTAHQHEELILRKRDGSDGATPAANAVAASALARLAFHLDRDDLQSAAIDAIKAYGRLIAHHPRAFARSLCVVDLLLDGPVELAFVGQQGSAELEALCHEAARHYLPNRIQALYDPASHDEVAGLPLIEGKHLVNGKAALYVCRRFACQAPIIDPTQVGTALSSAPLPAKTATTIAHPLPGRAAAAGTARYASRFAAPGYVPFGTTGLTVSRVGFGGYRIHDEAEEHREALVRALLGGINLIDTSTNYMDGRSERLAGSVIQELVRTGDLDRDELVVVSKIGYVQGNNYELARTREAQGDPFPEMVKLEDGLWHCIHPDFLQDQLQRALDRLELDTLDVCLLHNPEYSLIQAARSDQPLAQARTEFRHRLERAFAYLEDAVAEGRLGWYGVSSNTVTAPPSSPGATSFSDMLDTAHRVGGVDHHFRVLQLPLNLFEADAVFERNSGSDDSRTVLRAAQANSVAVLVNRPLNAFVHGQLIRLAEVEVDDEAIDFAMQLERVAGLEKAYREAIAPHIEVQGRAANPADFFRWTEPLQAASAEIPSLEQWAQIVGQITARVRRLATLLDQHLEGELAGHWASWRERYFPELDRLMRELRRQAAERARAWNAAVSAAIDPLLPEERRGETLSRKALWTVASTPGVTTVLNGMRRVEYVEDALGILAWPDLENVEVVYRAMTNVTPAA
jgi:uncharacterized protein YyaL (SSP411 family)/aryl-alcohol dehydrogenase-like predicted oxidoreductase